MINGYNFIDVLGYRSYVYAKRLKTVIDTL